MKKSLTDKDADKIRAMHKKGFTYTEIGQIMGVSNTTVGYVLKFIGAYRHRAPASLRKA